MSENNDGLSDLIKKEKKISSTSANTEVKTTVEKSISIENTSKNANVVVRQNKTPYSNTDFEGESSSIRVTGEANKTVEVIKEPIIEQRLPKTTKVVKVTTVETTTETSTDNTLHKFFPKDGPVDFTNIKTIQTVKKEENTINKNDNIINKNEKIINNNNKDVNSNNDKEASRKIKIKAKVIKKEKPIKKKYIKKVPKIKVVENINKTDVVISTEKKTEKVKKQKAPKKPKAIKKVPVITPVKTIAKTVSKSTVITSKEGAALERSMLVLAKQINTLADIFSIATKELKKDVEGEMIEKLDKILYENSIIAEAILTLLEEIKEDNKLNRSVIKKHIDRQEILQPFGVPVNTEPQVSQKDQELYNNIKNIAVDRTEIKSTVQNTTNNIMMQNESMNISNVSNTKNNEVREIRNDKSSDSHKNIRDIFSDKPSGYKKKTAALEIKGIPKINELPPSIDEKENM